MATPVGHGLLGAGIGVATTRNWRGHLPWFVFLAVSAVAADFDFLPGLLVGDINRWHHQGSHSLLAAFIWAAMTWIVFVWVKGRDKYASVRAGLVAGLVYASHLLLDCLTTDTRAPFGIPLLWPISERAFLAPVTPIPGVSHGVPGDGLATVLTSIFSLGNLYGALIECVVVLPILIVVWIGRRIFAR